MYGAKPVQVLPYKRRGVQEAAVKPLGSGHNGLHKDTHQYVRYRAVERGHRKGFVRNWPVGDGAVATT